MTLAEIENLLKQTQAEVKANTEAINALTTTVSNYATTDDLTALSKQINILQNNNILLQDSIAALTFDVSKVDHLSKLCDVSINDVAENDVLLFGNDGLWHNIQPDSLKINNSSGNINSVTKLSELTDVFISGVVNGQALTYNAINNKWINSDIATNGGDNNNNVNVDLSKYLTAEDAQKLYLPLSGGTVAYLNVDGLTKLNGDLLVKGGITLYNE